MKKIFKYTYLSVCALIAMASCIEDDDVSSLQIQAPANLDARYEIADDNSGTLTVIPTATAVSKFEIYFGDVDDEEPTVVKQGGKAAHTYSEGDFILRIVGVGMNGETIEMTEDIVIRFAPPENLQADIAISNRSIQVTPSADGAVFFNVYFGEAETEDPVQVMAGETASHIYEAIGDYTVRIVAHGAGAATTEIEEAVTINESLELPLTFEAQDITYAFLDFEGAATEIIDNPVPEGINTSNTVAKTIKTSGAQTYAGTTWEVGTPIDLNAYKKIKVKVYAPKAGMTVMMKLENATDNTIAHEVEVTNTVADEWEELVFDFSGADATAEYQKIILFFDFGNTGDGSEYLYDDINLSNEGAPVVALPLDFESSVIPYSFDNFGGATTTVVANPSFTGINTTSKVANLHKSAGAEVWAGSSIDLAAPIDFSTGKIFSVKTYSPESGITVKLKVENSDNPDVAYEVDATNTVANEWETLTYDFSGIDAGQEYDRVVIFFDFDETGDGSDFYFDDISLSDGSEALALPLNFESNSLDYDFTDFDGGQVTVIDNPQKSGLNASNKVAEMVKNTGQPWAGSYITLDNPINFSTNRIFKMKVYSPRVGATVLLKVENSNDGGIFYEKEVATTVANQWEELTFDYTEVDAGENYQKIVLIFDNGTAGDGSADFTYLFDDILLTN